ncbi:MAG: hypothetical protein H7176_01425 [Bdellovibrionales bacterium]|nr:hypothetical protein [Massilia sp.]
MPSVSAVLIAASALVILSLGALHLFFTYHGPAFHPRSAGLLEQLKADSPRISRATTMWRSALGFHASHSMGAIMFGLIYAYLALEDTGFLFRSVYLLALGMAVLCVYLALARLYWFKIPFRGIALAALLYGAGLAAHLGR